VKNSNTIRLRSNSVPGSRSLLAVSKHPRHRLLRFLAVMALLGASVLDSSPASEPRQIANVVQRGNFAYVYDAKGSQFLTLSAGDGIAGFTQSTVSIRRGNFIYTYNTKGSQVSVIPAGN
jgi:hypothetical protein